MKLFIATILTATIAFFACKHPEMVGGPCTYETSYIPAKVIAISAIDSSTVDLLFEVKMDEALDTLSYYNLNNNYLTAKQVSDAGAKEGAVFSLAFERIVKGTCTPEIRRLELKPYKAASH